MVNIFGLVKILSYNCKEFELRNKKINRIQYEK